MKNKNEEEDAGREGGIKEEVQSLQRRRKKERRRGRGSRKREENWRKRPHGKSEERRGGEKE